ncbi:MAG: ferrochelatase [Polyangiaceae bacterium]|nr:ferrochelatase [Polyangiaceae bacterium]
MPLAAGSAILLVAHGTPSDPSELPEFLRRIRRGRDAPAALVEELRHRYETIGGSPLLADTHAQAARLQALAGQPVFVGMRFAAPWIADALRAAASRGARRLAVVPLAPYSVTIYTAAVRAALRDVEPSLESPIALAGAAPWGAHPRLIEAHAAAIAHADPAPGPETRLVLTAHSLPTAAIRAGDAYEREVRASADAVAVALGRGATLAFQSQGADGGDWLGPSVDEALARLHAEGARRVVVAPIGFLAEHVETLFDLDHDARRTAERLGLAFVRVPALRDDPALGEALLDVATLALATLPSGAGA